MEPTEVMKRPYTRILIPDSDGRFTAEIMEFPGCVAFGDSAADAIARLEEVAVDWIAAAVEQGQDIPDPMDSVDFSGKLVLRMPRGLHRRATLLAEREGVSLNQFIVTCLAEAVGERARPASVATFHPHAHVITTSVSVNIGSASTARPQGVNAQMAQLGSAETGTKLITNFDIQSRREREREHA